MDSATLIEALGLVSYDNILMKCDVRQILLAKEESDGLRLVDRPDHSKIDN
jgi:hypothetical protein